MSGEVKEKENQVQELKQDPAMSVKFTNTMLKEFTNSAGKIEISDYQRSLIQGYFIGIDRVLKAGEENRIRKNESNKDPKFNNNLPMIWNNVNLPALAVDLVTFAKLGLDMTQENHLTPIPFKNRKTNKYDINLMTGYIGKTYIALKYAVEKPKAVTIELVYSKDVFKVYKKSIDRKYDTYEFSIENAFDRGEVVGGFGYIEYVDSIKNKLITMTKKDFEKRKPEKAAAEFWGGTKTEYVNGRKTEREIEGWYEEMCYKTLVREVYSAKHIQRDPEKVDGVYSKMKELESRYVEIEADQIIEEQGNKIPIDTSPLPEEETETAPPDEEVYEQGYEQESLPLEEADPEPASPSPGF